MPRPDFLAHGGSPMDLQAVDELIGVHRRKRLQLAFTVGLSGQATWDGDPQALVSEVLRLARVGAIVEHAAKARPDEPTVSVVREAADRWRLEMGGA